MGVTFLMTEFVWGIIIGGGKSSLKLPKPLKHIHQIKAYFHGKIPNIIFCRLGKTDNKIF
jgi:hypothetical protein